MAIAALPKCKSTAKIPKMKILSHIFDLPYKSGHLYRRLCCLSPFVAEDTTGTVECILLCVHSQHPEYDRRIAVGVERRDALGDALAHIVEMRSPATHHSRTQSPHSYMLASISCEAANVSSTAPGT